MSTNPFAEIPSVDALLEAAAAPGGLLERFPRSRLKAAFNAELDGLRNAIRRNESCDLHIEWILQAAARRLEADDRDRMRRVINATGIPLHTNLGRAPLSCEALEAVRDAASGYANLEYDIDSGKRGRRGHAVETILRRLTGCEAALTVNNNAAAVMLAVNTLAADGEVLTSRGELVEIGGSFRIPDVIATSKAQLREVGTTNRTRAADFESAVTPQTRLLLKVHPSNYRIEGFTESATREQLVDVGRRHGLPVVEDLGSGSLIDLSRFELPAEPTVQDALQAGVDVVTISGDKLLGGPQAGIALGKSEFIARMRKNPLFRALRPDKMTLAALEATLALYERPDEIAARVPVLTLLVATSDELRTRADRLRKALRSNSTVTATVADSEGFSGGGAMPMERIPTVVVEIESSAMSAQDIARRLRMGRIPVIARIRDDRVVIDLRAIFENDLPLLAELINEALECVT